MSVRDSWKRIADCHRPDAGRGLFRLAAGVAKRRLDGFEAALGQSLPKEVRESYLLHDGSDWLLDIGSVMTLDGVEETWRTYGKWQREAGYGLGERWQPGEIRGPIRPVWWCPQRIPMTNNGGGDSVMLDLDPPEGGVRGQVIEFSHEVGPFVVLARSWSEWLASIADRYESGEEVVEIVAEPSSR